MSKDSWIFRALRPTSLLFLVALCFCLAQLAVSFTHPLMDQYSFRQTQTAISAYWMLKGGPWLDYQTPVLGYPWSLPFEFPLYQWLVAILTKVAPFLSLDEAGRTISELFFVSSLWPLWRITSYHKDGKSLFLICAGLIMFSPLYAFWSRAFMIESAALLFSLWYVAALLDFLVAPSASGFAEMAIAASLAALIKITTFLGFSLAGAMLVLWFVYRNKKTSGHPKNIFKYVFVVGPIVLSVAALWGWVQYSDGLKASNLIGGLYTGKALTSWNFGTLTQRLSTTLVKVIAVRAPNEAVGSWIIVAITSSIAVIKLSRRQLAVYLTLLLLYIIPFYVFTNLHLVHHYYQYANSIFLVLALSYVAHALFLTNKIASYALIGLIVVSQMHGYWKYFSQDLTLPNREQQTLLADYLRADTQSTDAFIGFGLDWSSEVPYYAERRALLIPDAASANMLDAIASNPSFYTEQQHIGAIVVCPNNLERDPERKASYQHLLGKITTNLRAKIVGYCSVFS